MRAALFSTAIIAMLVGCDRIPGTPQFQARERARIEAEEIKSAQEIASRDLLDPSSVQFRDVLVRHQHATSAAFGNAPVVCGELNAKNSYGAYVGFKRFVVGSRPAKAVLESEGMPAAEDRAAAQRDCLAELRDTGDSEKSPSCRQSDALNNQAVSAAMFGVTWALACVD